MFQTTNVFKSTSTARCHQRPASPRSRLTSAPTTRRKGTCQSTSGQRNTRPSSCVAWMTRYVNSVPSVLLIRERWLRPYTLSVNQFSVGDLVLKSVRLPQLLWSLQGFGSQVKRLDLPSYHIPCFYAKAILWHRGNGQACRSVGQELVGASLYRRSSSAYHTLSAMRMVMNAERLETRTLNCAGRTKSSTPHAPSSGAGPSSLYLCKAACRTQRAPNRAAFHRRCALCGSPGTGSPLVRTMASKSLLLSSRSCQMRTRRFTRNICERFSSPQNRLSSHT